MALRTCYTVQGYLQYNTTIATTPTHGQQATDEPCVHEYVCVFVFVCLLPPEGCASI